MKNNKKNKINPKYVLAALSLLCIAGIGLSLFRGFSMPAAGTIVNSLMAPMQEGINSFGNFTAKQSGTEYGRKDSGKADSDGE